MCAQHTKAATGHIHLIYFSGATLQEALQMRTAADRNVHRNTCHYHYGVHYCLRSHCTSASKVMLHRGAAHSICLMLSAHCAGLQLGHA